MTNLEIGRFNQKENGSMTLHTILFFILAPICAAVLLGKTLVEYHKKKSYTRYLIQFICFVVFILVGVLMK
jgi:hypothetical protein